MKSPETRMKEHRDAFEKVMLDKSRVEEETSVVDP